LDWTSRHMEQIVHLLKKNNNLQTPINQGVKRIGQKLCTKSHVCELINKCTVQKKSPQKTDMNNPTRNSIKF